MPNWCDNKVSICGSRDSISKVRNLLLGEDNLFDFEKIIPMPDYIYRGMLGKEEKQIYGENNWYDWSCKNWGTKWNSDSSECWELSENELIYSFLTAWSPCEPVIEKLAAMFPNVKIRYSYFETGMCFFGKQEFENGGKTYEAEGDYEEHWFCDDEDSDEPMEKDEPGVFYSVSGEKEVGPAKICNFTYRETNDERSILLKGYCCDLREEKTEFTW